MDYEALSQSAERRFLEHRRRELGVSTAQSSAWSRSRENPAAQLPAATIDRTGARLDVSVTAWPAEGLIPGAVVTVTIVVANGGIEPADGVTIVAPAPSGANYRPGTLKHDGRDADDIADSLFGEGLKISSIIAAGRTALTWKLDVVPGIEDLIFAPTIRAAVPVVAARPLVLRRTAAPSAFAAGVTAADAAYDTAAPIEHVQTTHEDVEAPFYELTPEEEIAETAVLSAVETTPVPAPEPSPPVEVKAPPPPVVAAAPEPVVAAAPPPAPEPVVAAAPPPAPKPVVAAAPPPAPEPVVAAAPPPAPEPVAAAAPAPPPPIQAAAAPAAPPPPAAAAPPPKTPVLEAPAPALERPKPAPAPKPVPPKPAAAKPVPVEPAAVKPAPAKAPAPPPAAVAKPAPAPPRTPVAQPAAAAALYRTLRPGDLQFVERMMDQSLGMLPHFVLVNFLTAATTGDGSDPIGLAAFVDREAKLLGKVKVSSRLGKPLGLDEAPFIPPALEVDPGKVRFASPAAGKISGALLLSAPLGDQRMNDARAAFDRPVARWLALRLVSLAFCVQDLADQANPQAAAVRTALGSYAAQARLAFIAFATRQRLDRRLDPTRATTTQLDVAARNLIEALRAAISADE